MPRVAPIITIFTFFILVLQDKMRYGEIKLSLRTVTHKMLTQSLRELESDGLVDRTVHEVVPPKVE